MIHLGNVKIQSKFIPKGFTLVEIMIVVVIIGLLAAMAIPAFQKVRRNSQATRLANDMKKLAEDFQIMMFNNPALPNGIYNNAGDGSVPAGFAASDLPASIFKKPISERSFLGVNIRDSEAGPNAACVNLIGVDDQDMLRMVDAKIDDGVLTTGDLRYNGAFFTLIFYRD